MDLFAGPGGLDVAAAGLDVASIGVEIDPAACATRDAAGLATKQGDVREFDPDHFPDANVLAGGPPCQTFTVAGNGAGRKALDDVLKFIDRMQKRESRESIEDDLKKLSDERTGLVLEPLRWALKAFYDDRPYQAIVLEQVPAVLPVWKAYEGVLYSLGYKTDVGILRTEEFGVPQTRRRAVLIARLGDEVVALPDPTHRPYKKDAPRDSGPARLAPWVRMSDVLDEREGFYVVSNYGTGGDPKARGRRHSHEPSATVTGKVFRNRLHPADGGEWRKLTSSEAGRLQTFPTNYPWSGKDVGQQIGNAVPPRLGMHLICAALGWNPPSEEQLGKLRKWEGPGPSAGEGA
ncbi:DNA cytosine methyltransferase [Actinocorallia aurea]